MATVCYTRATLTSASIRTIFGEGATVENHVYTSPAYYTLVPHTGLCPFVLGAQQCDRDDRSLVPARLYTIPVTVHYQRTTYVTDFVTLYSTSCSVSQRPAPTPTPTTPTPITPTTSITVGSTTTQNSILNLPQTLSTVTGPSDTAVPNLGSGGTGTQAAATRKVPVGAIVGGTLGGLVVAALLGFLVFKLCVNTAKGQDQEYRGHLRRRRSQSQSAVDEQSSPSEGSSGALHPQGALQPQMQEYGATYANAYGGQGSYNIAAPGHQYTHVRQDSMGGIGAPMGVVHFSPPSSPVLGPEQGYYRQSGHYLGHAEIQDSTI